MDLLFKRYASPFLLLDEMIASGRMCEFIERIIEIRNEENRNDTLWDFYLHKVFNKSFDDFLRENKISKISPEESNIDFEATIKSSNNILQGFCPT